MATVLSDVILGGGGMTAQGSEQLEVTAMFTPPVSYTLWIDQVGAYLVCLADMVAIGGPAVGAHAADVSLLANLSRRHATLLRSGERYVLHAHAATALGGRPVLEKCDLCDGAELQLGSSVRMRFRIPSVVSGSARLEFLSDHRPAAAVDGVVLMSETCLLGPAVENHIRCPAWPSSLLLFRREGHLWVKGREDLFLDGQHAPAGGQLASGTIVTATDLRFRVERSP